MQSFIITPGKLTLSELMSLYHSDQKIEIAVSAKKSVEAAQQIVQNVIDNKQITYGVNTGFGKLANQIISAENLKKLQKNLVLSHAAGVGDLLSKHAVKLIMLLKLNCLAQGYSGVRWELIDYIVKLYNAEFIPCIPAKGSVGASGDLAPLAHFACALIGEGNVHFQNEILPAKDALDKIGLQPLTLQAKEGLALLNGTQVSCALLIEALMNTQKLFDAALYAGALSLVATNSDLKILDPRIHHIRRVAGQSEVAAMLSTWLTGSENRNSHIRVQDPYSLRCQPQVMGACLEQIRYVIAIVANEINAITDNPIVFSKDEEILSGGNFHGQCLAFGADALAPVIATIGNMSERRTALLLDENLSGLPAFLVEASGLNSGFMIAQVTAAALASENKILAHPASVDTIPTSANQEDHVSMATLAAVKLNSMIDNAFNIVAIELLAACQGLDLLQPAITTPVGLQKVYNRIRQEVPFYSQDRMLAADIEKIKKLIENNVFCFDKQEGSLCSYNVRSDRL